MRRSCRQSYKAMKASASSQRFLYASEFIRAPSREVHLGRSWSFHAAGRARHLPRLTLGQILAWADANHRRTGQWPGDAPIPVEDALGETWAGLNTALRNGRRGLPGGTSLARLLAEQRGVRSCRYPPPLSEKQILAWADWHRERTGAWPSYRSGPVEGTPSETWRMADTALLRGSRGLRGERSLASLLAGKRGARNRRSLPVLTVPQVLAWAKAHHRRTGTWPNSKSGSIAEAEGETWNGVDLALRWGYRGLMGGVSLAGLLARALGIRTRTNLPRLTAAQVVGWAKAHHRRMGEWPTKESGAIGICRVAVRWGACYVSTAKGRAGPRRGREAERRRS